MEIKGEEGMDLGIFSFVDAVLERLEDKIGRAHV